MRHIIKHWYIIATRECCGERSVEIWLPWNEAYSIHIECGPRLYGIGIATPDKVWQIYNGKYSSIRRS
jgi:hypothetical protein|tara:strand:+ start:578 stop:781 length:204 start_codon:yes stop_codon:yes gene_type:complete